MLNIDMCLTSRICEPAVCWRNRVFCGHFQNICKLYLANPPPQKNIVLPEPVILMH
jgi:hypothetical protein